MFEPFDATSVAGHAPAQADSSSRAGSVPAARLERPPVRLSASVVVCCYSEARFQSILRAIESIRCQTQPVDQVTVVVDNNEALWHRLLALVPLGVDVVFNGDTPGLSASRNAGIRASTADIVAFLDDDAAAEPKWLEKLIGVFEDPDVMGVGGKAVLVWDRSLPAWYPVEFEWAPGGSFTWLGEARRDVANPHGHNMAFRRAAFEAAGGFDVGLGRLGDGGQGGEERELCLRIQQVMPDARFVYEPAAQVNHYVSAGRSSFRYLFKRCFNEGVSKAHVQVAARKNGANHALSPERGYLRHLLLKAIPCRVCQIGVIALCIAATGSGFVTAHLRRLGKRSRSDSA